MKKNGSFAQTQRIMLLRSVYVLVVPIMLMFAMMACGTIVTDTAFYLCPTRFPSTSIPQTVGPSTPIVIPTLAPTVTTYRIIAPQDFYVGDAVFVGQPNAPLYLRFRLQQVRSQAAPPLSGSSRSLVTWQLEIRNLGNMSYETIPVALMVITRINTANGEQAGIWRTSEAAMKAAGFTDENDDALLPGTTRVYRLAAYVPLGSVRQLAYLLEGDGGNRITWVNASNPACSGDVAA
jgi:hypothetical protein